MTYLLGVLIALMLLDVARMRGRLGALPTLPPSDDAVAPTHRFVVAPGVTLDDATRRAASAWATAQGLDVVDLVPADLPALGATGLAQILDPVAQRKDRFEIGRSAGHAMLVADEVLARARADAAPADEVAFIDLAARLKRYASTRFAHAVAPAERAVPPRLDRRRAVLRALLGGLAPIALLVLPVMWGLIALGATGAPVLGAVALGVWQLQPALAIAGTAIRSRDLVVVTLLRLPLEVWALGATVVGRWRPDVPDPNAARRPAYDRLLADGVARFLEPRRETCPLCESRDLVVHRRFPDLLQGKPGRFALERCRGCGHVFQNPRLSLAGLDFYYQDFYDGLGEDSTELVFGFSAHAYPARAKMVADVAKPARWLDVGAGHGHFCAAARDLLPATRFDGLDFGDAIEDAQRRGWVDTAYRGMFPELAPTFAGAYDAVSMSHYLEHTRDVRAELAAARVALAPGGHLMIEVPDPEFWLARVLRTYWLPYFQPQHQHLVSIGNLDKLLREHGFEPLTWHRGAAHQPVDVFGAVYLWLGRIAPDPRLPWRRPRAVDRPWRLTVWGLGLPFLLGAWVIDHALGPLVKRGRHSNTYRVLARRGA